ncbi:MAG: metalloregulator ArsR/SmtB family transcription factor [Gemmatimonadota bacterium]
MHTNDLTPVQTRSSTPATVPELCDVPCFEEEIVRRVRSSIPDEAALERTRKIFALLADRNRLLILHALRTEGELCVCDLAHVLSTSVSTASHHLRKLRELGLLVSRQEGKLVLYSLSSPWAADMTRQVLEEVEDA